MGARMTHNVNSVFRYAPASLAILAFILPSAAQPPDLLKRVAARETENEAARNEYTYRQSVAIVDLDARGARTGEYREVRDIVFSAAGVRSEQVVEQPRNALVRLKLTEEDFRDIREVQPLLITRENAFLYESKPQGEEHIDGVDCWVLQVRPRQILQGQRFFEGTLWISKDDFGVVRMEGQAVPQLRSMKSENLFPRFTTLREKFDGKFWFPVKTLSDDTLYFRTGPQRIQMIIRYANYKHFSAESRIDYK